MKSRTRNWSNWTFCIFLNGRCLCLWFNDFDPVQSRMGLTGIEYTRNSEHRHWLRLYISLRPHLGYVGPGSGHVEFSRGWKGKELEHWTISGPLVKFTLERL